MSQDSSRVSLTLIHIGRLIDEYGVVMYGDFHAHSRKHNIFIYGCENRRNQDNHLREQIFPLLLHYNGGDKVSLALWMGRSPNMGAAPQIKGFMLI